jgi:hypothetical protein
VSNLLLSVLLTSIFSFLTPILVIGLLWLGFAAISQLPTTSAIGQAGTSEICQFLSTFGSGNPWQGYLIIGLTCSLVGALFDTYVSYHHPRSS